MDELYNTVKFLIRCLVDNVDKVDISSEVSGKKVKFIVRVPDNEMGKVLGQGGKTINAVRAVASTLARRLGKTKVQIMVESL
ncbi:MAG: KH domain-containing protein [bacterium]|nr:KH domain-containing protein [bacterium]